MDREFGNLLAIKDNYPKYVITLDEYTGASFYGIIHLPLRKFLSEHTEIRFQISKSAFILNLVINNN